MIRQTLSLVFGFLFFCTATQNAVAFKEADYNALPPFTTSQVKPNIMIMLDNSGSMKAAMYTGAYKSSLSFHGMFRSDHNYSYDATISVDTTGYTGTPYNIPVADIDTTKTGAFVINETCDVTLSGNNCWKGNFLNWMTTKRIDSARMVMVGGKIENRADAVGPWKIVGNNEPSDRDFTKPESKLSGVVLRDVTPYASGDFLVTSPAMDGSVTPPYDLYAKIQVSLGSNDNLIYDHSGNIVGEIGKISDSITQYWKTVSLLHTFTHPIVVAGPISFDGSDPSTFRIKEVLSNSFQIKVDEYLWKNLATHNQKHTTEKAYYLVMEEGAHLLDNIDNTSTVRVGAGQLSVTDTPVSYSVVGFGFASVPVLLGATVTDNGSDPVIPRFKNITTTGADVWIQEEEKLGSHTTETMHVIALEQGEFALGNGFHQAVPIAPSQTILVGQADVTENWTNVYPGDIFVASLQSERSTDPCGLRIDDSGRVKAEEDTSSDSEQKLLNGAGDSETETIGFIYRSANASLTFNIAVMTDEKPEGVLHDIDDTVRVGISFYNYLKDSNIYNGETTDGGTLRHFIPLNPFVKDSSKTTFREITTPVNTSIDLIVDAVEHYPLVWGTTPIAENLVEVINYFMQSPSADPWEYDDQIPYKPFDVNIAWDPYYYSEYGAYAPCAKASVLIFTDGYPYKDGCIPLAKADAAGVSHDMVDSDGDSATEDARLCDQFGDNELNGDDNLDDVAYWAHKYDLRDLEGDQEMTIYTVGFAGGTIRPILEDTASNGGGQAYAAEDGESLRSAFTDIFLKIQSDASSGTAAGVVSQSRSGVGGVYQAVFYQERKSDDFLTDGKRVYWAGNVHSFFIDEFGNMREDTEGNHILDFGLDYNPADGLFDAAAGDLYGDYIVMVDPDDADSQLWNKWYDWNNDNIIDDCVDTDLTDGDRTDPATNNGCDTFTLEELAFVWSAADWLNKPGLDTHTQRTYTDNTDQRYIFTFLDQNENMIADSGEQVGFTRNFDGTNDPLPSLTDCSASPPANLTNVVNLLSDSTTVYPYLTIFPTFDDTPDQVQKMQFEHHETAGNATPYECLLAQQTARLIDFVRGENVTDKLIIKDALDSTTEFTFSGFRNRAGDFDFDSSTEEVWRLGDVIYSTPTMVAGPSEGYHLLYRDETYADFVAKYQHRRGVVYVGANDGMMHALNGGFFDDTSYEFKLQMNGETAYELGSELWAYIPYNLLPHLYWITEQDYGSSHANYVDLKPRIFDAKIFEEEVACSNVLGYSDPGCTHPNGWGTVLVGGMRFGGGHIQADMNKIDGWNATTEAYTDSTDVDRDMTSAFFILDITNPEAPPTVLAELSFAGLGYTTSYPTVVPFRKDPGSGTRENSWYLVFGNGPVGATGLADLASLESAASLQTGKIFAVDLVALVSQGQIGDGATALPSDFYTPHQILDLNTFISDPIAVDYNLDYSADAVYFGTVSGDEGSGWGGYLRRILTDNDSNSALWDSDSVLLDAGKPIVAAPSVGIDRSTMQRWVYFGTGRYFVDNDEVNTDQQHYFGIKEPQDPSPTCVAGTLTCVSGVPECSSGAGPTCLSGGIPTCEESIPVCWTWGTISSVTNDLLDVTDARVYDDEVVEGVVNVVSAKCPNSISTWDDMICAVENDYDGWKIDFFPDTNSDGIPDETAGVPDVDGQRNLGQATLFGEVLAFTTYMPAINSPCLTQGESLLYGLYYKTGTAYFQSVMGSSWDDSRGSDAGVVEDGEQRLYRSHSLGEGLAITPNIHAGREDGSKVIIQTSTGMIETLEQLNPGITKSGKSSWKERR